MKAQKSTQTVLDAMRRIVRALRVSSRLAEKKLGISGAQLFVLQKLGDHSALSINELADRTLTHQSSVSVVVTRLMEKGLVLRALSKEDGRRALLSLSKKGRAFLKKAPGTAQERLISSIEKLSTKKQALLAHLLEDVVMKAGLSDDRPQLFFEEDKGKNK